MTRTDYVYRQRMTTLLNGISAIAPQIDTAFKAAQESTGDSYQDYLIKNTVGARKVLWDRLTASQHERFETPITLPEALALAQDAQTLVQIAADLVHQIATSRVYISPDPANTPRLSDKVMNEAYGADKRLRDAAFWMVCNFGLIDRIETELKEQKIQDDPYEGHEHVDPDRIAAKIDRIRDEQKEAG